jgi:hypothetical protein
LVPIFEEFGVDLVLAGHNPIYGRTAPLIGGQSDSPYARIADGGNGVVYITTGGGGEVAAPAYTDPFHQPPLGATFAGNHYTKIEVRECALEIAVIDIVGNVADETTIRHCP